MAPAMKQSFARDRSDMNPRYKPWTCILGFLILAAFSYPALATTWQHVKKICPIDGTQVTGHIPGSTFIPGTTPDFRPKGVGVDFFLVSMLKCPTCGFTTSAHRYDKTGGMDKQKVQQALEALETTPLFAQYDAAIAVEENWTAQPSALARLSLGAKWRADDTGEQDLIHARLDQAIARHQALLQDPELPEVETATITYLVGELLRQRGKIEQAVQWFDKARASAEEGLVTMIDRQAGLADKTTPIDPADLKDAAARQQIAAIRWLRERDDAEAIAVLKDLCLTCPHEMRESAIYDLIGDKPRAIHLPIFLEAIGNDHYRTVQGGARAVQQLRAKEAAPLIVKALQDPVDATEYRLMEALAATATENELPFLKAQVEQGNGSDRILLSLINTRSKQAIPLIKRCADASGYRISYLDNNPADLEAIKAFGPALRDVLPDLREADDDSGQSYLKVLVLSVAEDEASTDELAAAVERGNDLSEDAALALSRRLDPRGKDYLVKHINHLQSRDSRSIKVLYPLLEEDDFTAIQASLKGEYDQRERRIENLKELMALVQDEESKAMYQRQIDQVLENTSEWFVEPWLPLLGATNNHEAIPILIHYLDNENHQARAGAVRGLAFFDDDAVAEVLAKRLPKEDGGYVSAEIVKALGQSKSPLARQTLFEVIKQPTLVDTKLVWIEATGNLPAQQTKSVLQRWTESPDQRLAKAAHEALQSMD
jgi:HEAT repeat protein